MNGETDSPRERWRLVGIVAGFGLLLAAMYLWKELSLFRLEHRLAARHAVERDECMLARSRLNDAAVSRVSEMLELVALSLGWSVQDEARRQDWGAIEDRLLKLAERRAVRAAAYVGPDGSIGIATDEKLRGADGRAAFGDLTTSEEVVLRPFEDELRLMIPVYGEAERAGSLVVVFARDALLEPFERRDSTD